MPRSVAASAKAVLALALLTFLGMLTVVDQYGYADRAQPADVIVLLGTQVYPGGQIGPALERRAEHAAALYRRGLAPRVLCSGGVTTAGAPAEAVVACTRVAELGVPREALVLEDQSHSTEENAAFSTRIMRANGWRNAVLDTDDFHLFRATLMFERDGVGIYPSPAQATSGALNPLERVAREMREVVAVLWYWLRVAAGRA
jgi:uncharacterized SAM-binding protein YcdF (DUF218 family)